MAYDTDCWAHWCDSCEGERETQGRGPAEMVLHFEVCTEELLVLRCKWCGACIYYTKTKNPEQVETEEKERKEEPGGKG